MGYSTAYELRVILTPPYIKSVEMTAFKEFLPVEQVDMREVTSEDEPPYLQSSHDENRWYRHDDDMVCLSHSHPDLVFQLDGQGEQPDDRWRKYYKNGKVQEAKAVITLAPYDPKQLKTPGKL